MHKGACQRVIYNSENFEILEMSTTKERLHKLMCSYTTIFYVTIKSEGFKKINWHRKRSQYNGKNARYPKLYMHINIMYVYKCVSITKSDFMYRDRYE